MPGEVIRDVAWPFPGGEFPPELGAVVQRTVLAGEMPAHVVIHDFENDWLIGDGVNDPGEAGACDIAHVSHVIEADRTISDLADLPPGWQARRDSANTPWERSRHKYDD